MVLSTGNKEDLQDMKKSKRIHRCRLSRKNRGNKISPVGIRMSQLDLTLRIVEKENYLSALRRSFKEKPLFLESPI